MPATMCARFDAYVGIDYSGAGRPDDPIPGIQLYEASMAGVDRVAPPGSAAGWSRRATAEWLLARLRRRDRVIAALDFAFSFPAAALRRRQVTEWSQMLRAVRDEWRTHERSVAEARREVAPWGDRRELRLCEEETPRAKSVFAFGVAGQVASSTHAGLPWLLWLRERAPEDVAFWPFDARSRVAQARCVVAEAYPALYRPRYVDEGRYHPAQPSRDAEDAHATARWLREEDEAGELEARWLAAPRSPQARALAPVEGWILGVDS